MPLEHGLDSINRYDLHLIRSSAWPVLIANQNMIINLFQSNPELLAKPYQFSNKVTRLNHISTTRSEYCDELPSEPFASLIKQIGNPAIFADALTAFPEWERIGQLIAKNNEDIDALAYAQQYALIDLLIVFVTLMNHYVADRSQIRSCYNNFVVVDALGRTIETRAITEITKVIERRAARIFMHDIALCLIEIVKADLSDIPMRVYNDGRAFELQCSVLLNAGQYDVERTPITGDFGADLIATKSGLSFAIQCKDTLRSVGIKAVQEAVAARSHYGVDFAVICSSGGFTDAAMSLAATTGAITCNAVNLVRCLEAV